MASSSKFRTDALTACGAQLRASLPAILRQPGGLHAHLTRLVGDARLGDICGEDVDAATRIIMGERGAGGEHAGPVADARDDEREQPAPWAPVPDVASCVAGLLVALRNVPDDCLEEAIHRLLPAPGGDNPAAVIYHHPANNGGYLEAEVLPVLRQGMVAMMQQAERYSVDLAGGAFWVDGWRPDDWKPMNMLRWLAQWLAEHPEGLAADTVPAEAAAQAPPAELDRPRLIRECFRAMDADGTGHVEGRALRTMLEVAGGSTAEVRERADELTRPILEREHTVASRTEFESIMHAGTANVPDGSFLHAVKRGLKDRLWTLLPKEYQYKSLFAFADKGGAGWLEIDELMRICRSLRVSASDDNSDDNAEYRDLLSMLSWLDKSQGSKATPKDLFAALDAIGGAVGEAVLQERLIDMLIDLDHESTPEELGLEEEENTL